MIAGLIGNVLLRSVPSAFAAGVDSGQYQVYGSIIRSVADGRIVAHLQEAGGLSKLMGLISAGPAAPLKFAADGIQIYQNHQIKSGIDRLQAGMGMLNQLGVANLALGAVGIGVSVAGFAIVSAKIDRVRAEVEKLGDRIDAVGSKVDALQQDLISSDLDDLRALAWNMDEAWNLGDSAAERRWHDVAGAAPRLAARFERRAGRLLAEGPAALTSAEPLLDALSLAGSLRVSALAAAGEHRAAREAAGEGARVVDTLTGKLGLSDLVRDQVRRWEATPGTPEWGHAIDRATEIATPLAARLRAREAAAATRAAPLTTLAAKGVSAREWMAAAHEEAEAPLLLMLEEPA